MANQAGNNGNLNEILRRFLAGALQGGFPGYGGERVAGIGGQEQSLFDLLFGAAGQGGGAFQTGLSAISDIAQQDALQRAQTLLQPSTQRSIEEFTRSTRERANLGNNLLSTGTAEQESRGVADILGQQQSTLAGLIPQLTALRLQAASGLPGYIGQGINIAEIPRGLEQQRLDAAYQEFLRTTPSGGPLESIIALLSGTNRGRPNDPQRGPTSGQQALGFIAQLFGGPFGASILNQIFSPNQTDTQINAPVQGYSPIGSLR